LYATADGHIALAMMDISALAKAIGCDALKPYARDLVFSSRDEIKSLLATHLATKPTKDWLTNLHAAGLWAMEVMDWKTMREHEGYKKLEMEQTVKAGTKDIITTRCPVRIDGERLFSSRPAPKLGEHNAKVMNEIIND
jgi:crotonobetainyl-CoA:carnitine CoA-transferase CaiB-like acyl-CoA transferase